MFFFQEPGFLDAQEFRNLFSMDPELLDAHKFLRFIFPDWILFSQEPALGCPEFLGSVS